MFSTDWIRFVALALFPLFLHPWDTQLAILRAVAYMLAFGNVYRRSLEKRISSKKPCYKSLRSGGKVGKKAGILKPKNKGKYLVTQKNIPMY